MKKGFLSIILHAHLPYVRHPEHDSFFEEIWLFEAMTECYIPLCDVFERLQKDDVNYRLTLSLSPTLISMLRDDLLQTRYQNHLNKQIELAEKEIIRTLNQPPLQKLARLYRRFFISTRNTYNKYNCDLLMAFKKFHAQGHLELITTAATHGFLPLLSISETAVRNQIEVAVEMFESNIGFAPTGFWIPECAYYPGLEVILGNAGIKYFFTDTHGVMEASETPDNGVYAPLDCGNGVMAFARDPNVSQQVWSAEQGYPGDVNYREYYSDIGFDLDMGYLAPYILDGQNRISTGIKYHRITGEGLKKECYQPKKAKLKVKQDADDFVSKCQQQIDDLSLGMDRPPVIVAPYDAELFGHWWFEGPCWLEMVLRKVDESNNIETISCGDYLKRQGSHQVAIPASSTWGEDGYCSYWVNEENDWIYPFLHKAADQMEQLVIDFKGVTVSSMQKRALNQAVRSILLAQASDWPFIMKSGTTTDYAKKTITDQLARFNYLHESIRKNKIDERYLCALELMDNIFPDVDFRKYKSIEL
ncbi:MAG: glycoside hydrolase family 57 protein [Methylococcaceae bacterium]